MPRIIIDHSDNIKETIDSSLFKAIHEYFASTGRFNVDDVKSRAIAHDNYYLMDGDASNAFISIHLRIMEGREESFRKELSEQVFKIAERYFTRSLEELNCNLTCFVSEITKASYSGSSSYSGSYCKLSLSL